MDWIRLHPIAVALISAIVLIVVGIFIAGGSFARAPGQGGLSWGQFEGARMQGTLIGSNRRPMRLTEEDVYVPLEQLRQSDVILSSEEYVAPKSLGTPPSNQDPKKPLEYDESAIDEIIASVSASARIPRPLPDGPETRLQDLYEYLPFKVAQLSENLTQYPEMTKLQNDLFTYGNEVGSSIETYFTLYPNQAETLKRFVEDVGNPEKAEDVARLAEGLETIGDSFKRLEDYPGAVTSVHKRLGESYTTLGRKLRVVASARKPEELLEAVISYNQSADVFAQNYITLATIISVNEVPFTDVDAGRFFVFSAQ